MRQIKWEETKKIQIGLLDELSRFCENNGLSYFLAYGTLIGCLRHKGFIPWDDDIDVVMPRKDYNRLIKEYKPSDSSKFELIEPLSEKSRHPYIKLTDKRTTKIEDGIEYSKGSIGVDIDVFPIDGQPDNEVEFIKWKRKLIRKYYEHYYYIIDLRKNSLKKKLIIPFMRLLFRGKKNVLLHAQKLHDCYPYDDSVYVGVLESIYVDDGDRVEKWCYEDYEYKIFEKNKYRVPIGYDTILKSIYGDYMTLPPIEERVMHHTNVCYWID